MICTDCGTEGHDNCLSGGQYPRPWRVTERVHSWWVTDARGGIVAGGFASAMRAHAWLDRWPNPPEVERLKYEPGHTVHGDDCMSDWSENLRRGMTPETIAANHRLHMHDVEGFCRHGLRGVHPEGTC